MRLCFFLLTCVAVLSLGVEGFKGRKILNAKYKSREPPLPERKSFHPVETHWIEQRLDHFNPRDNRTWQMQCISNDEHFVPGGPIILYIGGEWPISGGSLLGGQIYDIAQQHKGYLFYTEHRYYGSSMPTLNASTPNFQFLSVDQSLADIAYCIEHIKATIPGLENSKVVVVGGSYAGNMAAWFRLKYPHHTVGALASSAPVLAVADFYKFNEVVNTALSTIGSQSCVDTIREAVDILLQEFRTEGGPERIAEQFNLCIPVYPDIPNDLETFFKTIAGEIGGVVQYHRNGDIERACKILDDDSNGDAVGRLVAFLGYGFGSDGCVSADYKSSIEICRDVTWGSPGTILMRQWIYQTCTEFGYYQTSLSDNQPFAKEAIPLQHFIDYCRDCYEDIFIEAAAPLLARGVQRSNVVYGELNIDITNVIFTHGSIDPWHAIGVLEDINESSPAIVVPGYSHCADLQGISPNDSDEMRAAKLRVQEIIASWLK